MVTENVNIIVSLNGARTTARGFTRIGRSARRASSSMRLFGAAFAALGIGLGIRSLVRLSDSATDVSNRIRVTTDSTKQFVAVQSELFNVARRTGQSIEDTARLFQRLRVGTNNLAVSNVRVIKVVEGLNAALLVSGATAREASAALLQFGQGLSSDNLSGEELRSLRENLAPFANELAVALGTTIGQLKILGAEGKLTAAVVFPAAEKAAAKFLEQLRNGDVIFTFAAAFNRVRNEIVKFFEIVQRASGATASFNETIFELTDGLAEKLVRGLILFLGSIKGVIVTISIWIKKFQEVDDKATTVLNALKALGGAFAVLGRIGLAVAALLAAPFLLLRSAAQKLRENILKLGNALGVVEDATLERGIAAADAAQNDLNNSVGFMVDQLKAVGRAYDDNILPGAEGVTKEADKALTIVDELIAGLERALVVGPVTGGGTNDDPLNFGQRARKNTRDLRVERGDPKEQVTDVTGKLSEDIATSVKEGFGNALRDGDDLFAGIREGLTAAADEALIKGFEQSFDDMQGLLEEVFNSVAAAIPETFSGPFAKLGPALKNILQGAIQFAVLQGLNALLGGGGNDTTSSSSNVQSAVTSTQAVRGIVAGPTEIAIANVGRNIAEAFLPLLDETREQTSILRGILANGRASTSSGGGAAISDTNALAFGSAPLTAT